MVTTIDTKTVSIEYRKKGNLLFFLFKHDFLFCWKINFVNWHHHHISSGLVWCVVAIISHVHRLNSMQHRQTHRWQPARPFRSSDTTHHATLLITSRSSHLLCTLTYVIRKLKLHQTTTSWRRTSCFSTIHSRIIRFTHDRRRRSHRKRHSRWPHRSFPRRTSTAVTITWAIYMKAIRLITMAREVSHYSIWDYFSSFFTHIEYLNNEYRLNHRDMWSSSSQNIADESSMSKLMDCWISLASLRCWDCDTNKKLLNNVDFNFSRWNFFPQKREKDTIRTS